MLVRRDYFNQYIQTTIDSIASGNESSFDQVAFEKAFLKTASHSPDNVEAIPNVEFGETTNEYGFPITWGLKIKGQNVRISDIAAELEYDEIYDLLAPKFPGLSREQISAALRIITMYVMGAEIDAKSET